MGFWGSSFRFNSISCEEYDLMIYDIGGNIQGTSKIASIPSIVDESVGSRIKPYFYGTKYDDRLKVEIVFGVNQERIDGQDYLDRYEINTITSWLTGHDEYLYLEIDQEDMEGIRYKCIVSSLEIIEYGELQTAFKANFMCDGIYAYMYPTSVSYDIIGDTSITINNISAYNGYYYPSIEIAVMTPSEITWADLSTHTWADLVSITWEDYSVSSISSAVSIINSSDNDREFLFEEIPASITAIEINNDLKIIENDQDISLYPYFNYQFLRLVKGNNSLVASGIYTLTINYEFPINVGG